MNDEKKLLSWFLGPKSENASFLEEALILILRDYFHWRRNYFPADSILLTKRLQRELEPDYDSIYQNLLELMAELRRNFPFYSPRYIGHMLSDTLLTSIIGYVAGMMYNPNNVTPEAAPVTVNMEIEACNIILEMLGFNPPPSIPEELNAKTIEKYKKQLEAQFGWAHLTSGGTTANLEALWVARAVKYAPLAVKDIAEREGLDIRVKLPDGQLSEDIKDLPERQLINIKPNEAIYLLSRYVAAFRNKYGISIDEAGEKAHDLLKKSPYHLANGIVRPYQEFPPVIFVAGTAHYSFHKAADILGIGRENIEFVNIDSEFRMDVAELENRIEYSLAQNRVPLAVIAIVGTTEEGAVDPVHRILDLRSKYEKHRNLSFWIHADAAWGGYFRSLFNLSLEDETQAMMGKLSNFVGVQHNTIETAHSGFFNHLRQEIRQYAERVQDAGEPSQENKDEIVNKIDRLNLQEESLSSLYRSGSFTEYIKGIKRIINENLSLLGTDAIDLDLTLEDRINLVNDYVSDEIPLHYGAYSNDLTARWGSKDVCSALLGISLVDSITIDPHKMGYINYPCGVVAFRNDRVRHFILQKAPYITSVRQDILVHMPPRHIEAFEQETKTVTEAFAPFILEGSRPGAAATSLWLTMKTIPPSLNGYGLIVKSSILAARELYEWLNHWEKIVAYNTSDTDFEFIPLTLLPPDTNIVIFCIKKKTSNSLRKLNELTGLVYENFTIQAELGENEYSYAQPFFLSKTTFKAPLYPFDSLRPFFTRHFKQYTDRILSEYRDEGLTVLRATVMNPYVWVARHLSDQNVLREFIQELSKASTESVRQVV